MSLDPKTRSLLISVGCHVAIILCFVISFEKTKAMLPSQTFEPNKPIVEAVVVNQQAVQKEVDRLAKVEKAKIEREKARKREIEKKEKEAIEKREKEEALLLELKQKNEQLKKEAEIQRVAKIKREKEEKIAKAKAEKLEKEKKEKEAKEAKEAALAEKKKLDEEKKAAEAQAQSQANSRAKNEYMALIRSILHQNWTKPTGFDLTGLACVVLVDLSETGEVIRVSISSSSGNVTYDRSTEVAVFKSSPLPVPQDPALAREARQFEFTFLPEAV